MEEIQRARYGERAWASFPLQDDTLPASPCVGSPTQKLSGPCPFGFFMEASLHRHD